MALEYSRVEPSGQCHAQFATPREVGLGQIPLCDHRFLYFVEWVAFGDATYRRESTGSVIFGADEYRIGQRLDLALDRIERAVEEVLHAAGHVAEVLRRADKQPLRPEQILRLGGGGAQESCFDVFDRGVGRAVEGGLGHAPGAAALRVVYDEQALGVHPMESRTFAEVIAAIDRRHAGDPAGRELDYAERMTAWLGLLAEVPSEDLKIAVRAQHFERWRYPREEFPLGREGYLRWRRDAARRQAQAVGGLLASCGVGHVTIERVGALMQKRGLKRDPEAQALEDCACLVFLESELDRFAERRDAAQVARILKRTLAKMSPAARQKAGSLSLTPTYRMLLERLA